jgi:hypothetical protein
MTGASVRRVPGMTCGAAAVRCTSTSAGAQLRGCSAHVHGPRCTRLYKIHRPRREIGLQRRILHQRMPGGLRAVGVAFEPHAASEGTLGVAVHCVVHPQALAHDAHVEHGSMPVSPARQWRPTWSVMSGLPRAGSRRRGSRRSRPPFPACSARKRSSSLATPNADAEHDIRIANVGPSIGHRSPSERGGQTGHRGAVSNP